MRKFRNASGAHALSDFRLARREGLAFQITDALKHDLNMQAHHLQPIIALPSRILQHDPLATRQASGYTK